MRPRIRDLGVHIGQFPTGTYNTITDVPGVWVGHRTVIRDAPTVARTGVTMVVPARAPSGPNPAPQGFFSVGLAGCEPATS
jgi:D-aminopeptidase